MFPWGELSTSTLQNVCRDLNARRTADRAREDALELLHTLEIGVAKALQRQQSMPPPPKRKYQRRTPAPVRTPAPFPMPPPKRKYQRQTPAPVQTAPFPMPPPTPTTTFVASRRRGRPRKATQAPVVRVRVDAPQPKTPSPNKKRRVFDGVEVDFPPALRRHYYQRCLSSREAANDLYSDQVSTPGAELEEDSQSVHSDDILRLGRT